MTVELIVHMCKSIGWIKLHVKITKPTQCRCSVALSSKKKKAKKNEKSKKCCHTPSTRRRWWSLWPSSYVRTYNRTVSWKMRALQGWYTHSNHTTPYQYAKTWQRLFFQSCTQRWRKTKGPATRALHASHTVCNKVDLLTHDNKWMGLNGERSSICHWQDCKHVTSCQCDGAIASL